MGSAHRPRRGRKEYREGVGGVGTSSVAPPRAALFAPAVGPSRLPQPAPLGAAARPRRRGRQQASGAPHTAARPANRATPTTMLLRRLSRALAHPARALAEPRTTRPAGGAPRRPPTQAPHARPDRAPEPASWAASVGQNEVGPRAVAVDAAAAVATAKPALPPALANAWAAYDAALASHPVAVKAATSFVGFLIGDLIAQSIVGLPYDAYRTLRLVLFGVCMDGPIGKENKRRGSGGARWLGSGVGAG